MNVYGRVMFEFNCSVGDIKNSELGEGIVCLGEGSGGKGGGKWGKGGGKWGKRGREVRVRGEGSGECLPRCPPPQFTTESGTAYPTRLHVRRVKTQINLYFCTITKTSLFKYTSNITTKT